MNKIEDDIMLKELADFIGLNIKYDLEVESIEEMSNLYYAHEISEDENDEVKKFLTQLIYPTSSKLTPVFIFKALKFNDKFYVKYLALIRATEFMRQEVYYSQEYTEAIAASNDDNQIILQACYQNNTILEFEVVDAMVYLNDSNDRIVILLDISNEDFSSMLEKKYYIELFKNGVEKYKTNVIPNRNGELIEFSTSIPKGIIELGIQWGISEEEK